MQNTNLASRYMAYVYDYLESLMCDIKNCTENIHHYADNTVKLEAELPYNFIKQKRKMCKNKQKHPFNQTPCIMH